MLGEFFPDTTDLVLVGDSNLRLFDVDAAGCGHRVDRGVVDERPDRVPALELLQVAPHGPRGFEPGVRRVQLEVAPEAGQAERKIKAATEDQGSRIKDQG